MVTNNSSNISDAGIVKYSGTGLFTGITTPVNVQVFTGAGTYTYTPTSGMLQCIVQCLAGGGAGGGRPATTIASGSGGGAGEYSIGLFSSATIGGSQTVTIGAGGTGVSGGTGNTGATTSLGSLITSVGGVGGVVVTGITPASGALGGTGGTGGFFRTPGNSGGNVFISTNPINAGVGANSELGAGGVAPVTTGTVIAGNPGLGFGSGGSGAWAQNALGSAAAGGNGADGIVIITEYLA